MKSLNTLTGDTLEQLIDYKVVDQTGASIGTLHSLWSDPTTGAVEFLGVKTGWLFGHNHVVPAVKAELDDANNVVRLPYSEIFIKEAPSISADAEISELEEDDIFRYYSLPRRPLAGEEGGGGGAGYAADSAAYDTTMISEPAEEDSAATYIGFPIKIDKAAQNVSITDRSDAAAGGNRLRKTARPAAPSASTNEVPPAESLTTIEGMTSPTNEDFINGGAAAVTTGIGSGTAESSDYAPITSPGGDTNFVGSTVGASKPAGNEPVILGKDSQAYTEAAETHDLALTDPAANPDPLSGEPGSHPVGTGVGAVGVGTAGAAIGAAVGGPVGALVGGIAGAIGGGLAGKGVAESINPTLENEYWQANFTKAPYYEQEHDYTDYEPAYRVGYEAYGRIPGLDDFDAAAPQLEREYDESRGASKLGWDKAKHASRDAWNKVKAQLAGEKSSQG